MSRLQALQQAFKAATHNLPKEPPTQTAIKCPVFYREQYTFTDEQSGEPTEGMLYCAETAEGQCIVGRTDREGNTLPISTQGPEQITLRWGREAATYLREQGIDF